MRARARLNMERELSIPQVALRAGVDQDPDLQNWRLGLAIVVPVWNRREGPIAEAAAGISQVDAQAEQRKLGLLRDLDTAYNQYLINLSQVSAYEEAFSPRRKPPSTWPGRPIVWGARDPGLPRRAAIYRQVRLDYLNARYELQRSWIEIQRLRASDLRGPTMSFFVPLPRPCFCFFSRAGCQKPEPAAAPPKGGKDSRDPNVVKSGPRNDERHQSGYGR